MCVCFGDPCAQKFLDWETILRDFCVDWIISWVVCWIAFISVFFTSQKTVLKSWLDTSSTPPWYLAICRASQAFFLMQSRHLLNTWWIDRESSCLLDSFSTPGGSIELLFLKLILCCSIPSRYLSYRRPIPRHLPQQLLDTSRYLSCRALLRALYILSLRFFSHFFDLSQFVRDCSFPKHSHFHSKLVPQGFFKLFQVSLYLVSF